MASRRIRALTIAGASLVLALAAAEAGLRALRPVAHLEPLDPATLPAGTSLVHRRSGLPGLNYELVPGAQGTYAGVEVSVNALGARGPEVQRVKPPGTFRIVAVGDSLTFGFGAPQAGTWPAALERQLAPRAAELGARAVEVVNLGVSGYNAADEAVVVERRALELDPDWIVVGYFLNDPQRAPLQPIQRIFRDPPPWERLHLWRLVDAWRFARAKARHGGDGYRMLHARDGAGWAMVQGALRDMRRASAARGVPLLLVTLPAFPPGPDWSAYPWRDLHEQVLAEARAAGLAAFDVLPAFAADGRRPKDLGADFEHPNPAGAEVIAAGVAAEILRLAGEARSR
ncbi:MAG: SGNH/GDSL hydrolase family protein [Planctomycetes bacterium]|nr:SGNH/GDSL hydrolase family protein [Planctomycetota bacterium]